MTKQVTIYKLSFIHYLIIVLVGVVFLLLVPTQVQATEYVGGELIKGSSDAVYYVGTNLKRYVFPNERVFRTWYQDFGGVTEVSDTELNSLPLAGVVRYKPGVRMIKVPDDPKVYTVGQMGLVRHVENEEVAAALYGSNWNTFIDDMLASFFVSNYTIGGAISEAAQFIPAAQTGAATSISEDFGLILPTVPMDEPAEQPAEEPVDEMPEPEPETATTAFGHVTDIAYAPSNSEIAYLVSSKVGVGVWRSNDGGKTWAQVRNQGQPSDITVHTTNPNVVLLVDGGLIYRTENGGSTWDVVTSMPAGIGNVTITEFAWVNTDKAYALSSTWLIESDDAGKTWSKVSAPESQGWTFTNILKVHPVDDFIVFAGSTKGIQRSIDGGDSWTQKKPPVQYENLQVVSLDFNIAEPLIYYTTTDQGLWYTGDNGTSWNITRVNGVADNELRNIDVSDSNINILYVATKYGVFKSIDRAVHWNKMDTGMVLEDIDTLAIDPVDENKVMVGTANQGDGVVDGEGLYRTIDGGESWTKTSEIKS